LSKRRGACVYCGDVATTDDHVPPKAFFVRPLPSNLVTVDACEACNRSFDDDDEYVSIVLSSVDGAHHFPGIEKHWSKIVRCLSRPQAIGLRTRIVNQFSNLPKAEARGLPLTAQIEDIRVRRVISRCAVGLHAHEFGCRAAPDNWAFSVDSRFPNWASAHPESRMLRTLASSCLELACSGDELVLGNGEVVVRRYVIEGSLFKSAWGIRVFGASIFYSWILPVEFASQVDELLLGKKPSARA